MIEKAEFKFEKFNPTRAMRGAPAAQVRVKLEEEPGEYLLWMSKLDIGHNIKNYGEHPELLKALENYNNLNRK